MLRASASGRRVGPRGPAPEPRANDAGRAPEDFLDTSHFRAIMVDPDTNYPVFAQYLPSRTQARRAMETARQAKNLLVSHRRSGDTPTGAVIAALQAMHQLLEHADVSAAEELAHLQRSVAATGVVIVPASSFAWLDVDPNADFDQLITLGDLALDGIRLRGQAVDDSVVLRVSHIESLQYVELSGTAVTDEGVQALARSRPALRVSRPAEPGDGIHAAASLNGQGTADNTSRERLLLLLDAFGLVFLVALLALFAVQGIRSRPGDAGLWATWAVIVAPVVTSWCLKPRRPRYLEAFWVGGVFGGLVVALWVLASWRGPPLDGLDMAGPAVAVLASITVAVGLGWTIRLSRPSTIELVLMPALMSLVIVAAWNRQGLSGTVLLAFSLLWLWTIWTTVRLLVLRGERGKTSPQPTQRRWR